jgi:hypothetical protein
MPDDTQRKKHNREAGPMVIIARVRRFNAEDGGPLF